MDWVKISPALYLAESVPIPDGILRLIFLGLAMQCLKDGSLPDDDDALAYGLSVPVEYIKNLRPHLNRLGSVENGRLRIQIADQTLAERQEFSRKKAEAGQKGGKSPKAMSSIQKQAEAVLDTAKQAKAKPSHSYMHELTNEKQERESMQSENPLSHPLSSALLDGAGFSEMQRESLSSMQYAKLGAAVTRLTAANITVAQIQAARKAWWGNSSPNFDQLADEALKVASGKSVAVVNSKTHYQDGREKPEHLKGFVC